MKLLPVLAVLFALSSTTWTAQPLDAKLDEGTAVQPVVPSPALTGSSQQVLLADGFDLPVGQGELKGYRKARGFQGAGHLGEDWNGNGGGDSDLGDPVYAVGHGLVVFARDYRLGWGNVVIVRHAYTEEGLVKYVDSLYGHLNEIQVQEGQMVRRRQQLGTIGNNRGMYEAHLHFEMRKNLAIGMNRSAFARDFSNYWDPTRFIEAHRVLPAAAGQTTAVPINTFTAPSPRDIPPPSYAGTLTFPVQTAQRTVPQRPRATPGPRGPFVIDRFSDLR